MARYQVSDNMVINLLYELVRVSIYGLTTAIVFITLVWLSARLRKDLRNKMAVNLLGHMVFNSILGLLPSVFLVIFYFMTGDSTFSTLADTCAMTFPMGLMIWWYSCTHSIDPNECKL